MDLTRGTWSTILALAKMEELDLALNNGEHLVDAVTNVSIAGLASRTGFVVV